MKAFLSLSVGFHLLLFGLLFLFIRDLKAPSLSAPLLEVSFLPVTKEERKIIQSRKEKGRSNVPERNGDELGEALRGAPTEAKEISHQSEKREAPQFVKETIIEERPQTHMPLQTEPVTFSLNPPHPFPAEMVRWKKEEAPSEGVVIASLGSVSPPIEATPSGDGLAKRSPSFSEKEAVFIQPRYAVNPKPPYPREAKRLGYEGEVLLRVEVLSNGRVGEVEVKRSSGHEILDRSAIAAVKEWRFIPARRGETSVSAWVLVPVLFQLR